MSTPFHRTPQGLSNQAIFAKVDLIVFAEGGSMTFSMEELERGNGDTSTHDVAFWFTIMRAAQPTRKVEVRSVGNKLTIQAIATLVINGAVSRVVVAMDRDFDDRRRRKLSHPNVFYTYGYSWENDVFCEEVTLDVLGQFATTEKILQSVREALADASVTLRKSYSKVVRLDHALASAGREVTRREELRNAIRLHERYAPAIMRSTIAAELIRCRASGAKCRLGPPTCATVHRDLFGHAVARWWLGQIHHLLRAHFGTKLSNDAVARLAIATYSRSTGLASLQYYSQMAAAARL